MPPGESAPEKTAPEPLRLVQRFVNSVDLENDQDELTSPGALRDWLAERDLIDCGERVTAADLKRAVDVREGLRAFLLDFQRMIQGAASPTIAQRLLRGRLGPALARASRRDPLLLLLDARGRPAERLPAGPRARRRRCDAQTRGRE